MELNNLDVVEMTQKELVDIDGGGKMKDVGQVLINIGTAMIIGGILC